MKQLRVKNIQAWKEWLEEHHHKEEVVWLVFQKKGAGSPKASRSPGKGRGSDSGSDPGKVPGSDLGSDPGSDPGKVPFTYQEALDEALCMGWVDSLVKRIDEKEYMRKFTPRKPTSTWSEINKKRVEELIRDGRMRPPGMKTIEVARKNGMWDKGVTPPQVDDSLPEALLVAFQDHPRARDHYFAMVPRAQKQFNIWINMAKRAETVRKRVEESISLLEQGQELGLK